ncbi:MAG: 16S rRNA (cytosine(1402)-N(4))-methyltransferase RsmH, partial [Pseudomonadota bacterium]
MTSDSNSGLTSDLTRGGHTSVLLAEVLEGLGPIEGKQVVDATLGAGGYARAFLDRGARVIGIDRDPSAIERARQWARPYGDRFTAVEGQFGDIRPLLLSIDVTEVDAIAFDYGVSSMQVDQGERGFSFREDGPLSMRMDGKRPNARDVVAEADADALTAIFKVFGEERHARRIANAIVRARTSQPIHTTLALSDIVASAQPRAHQSKIHPATRVFQALRIFVNNELAEIATSLAACEALLRPNGRLACVTFHSLEDRIVKRFISEHSADTSGGSRHLPADERPTPSFRSLTKKVVSPTEDEVSKNPRARSAKLRLAE